VNNITRFAVVVQFDNEDAMRVAVNRIKDLFDPHYGTKYDPLTIHIGRMLQFGHCHARTAREIAATKVDMFGLDRDHMAAELGKAALDSGLIQRELTPDVEHGVSRQTLRMTVFLPMKKVKESSGE
jgi:hypothetical protein